MKTAVHTVKTAQVYPQSIIKEAEVYLFEDLEEETVEFTMLKSMFDAYSKNCDTEKFYSKYYAAIPLNSTEYFKGISRNAATLLSTKAADCMIVYGKNSKVTHNNSPRTSTNCTVRERLLVCNI